MAHSDEEPTADDCGWTSAPWCVWWCRYVQCISPAPHRWGNLFQAFDSDTVGTSKTYIPAKRFPIGNAYLQQVMSKWVIAIFDNILILANGYAELYERFDLFLDCCIRYNVTLKIAKTWLGFPSVTFFGYLCRKDLYELTEGRKQSLHHRPFPGTSFLGFALFF